MIVSPKTMLRRAHRGGYAVGAFNVNNLEILQGVVEAAVEMRSPLIVQTSQGAIEYAGMELLAAMVHTIARDTDIPIALHLDHGTDVALVMEAIDSGLYTSVMIDTSRFPLQDNIRITREVVKRAHARKIFVEAELGAIPGKEDQVDVMEADAFMTRPEEATRFVKETDCDALAVSIGTKHGVSKFASVHARLDIERLRAIASAVNKPLVLHGASSVYRNLKDVAEAYGADLSKAFGVPDGQLKKAIKNGIAKINTDSDIRIAFTGAVDQYMTRHPNNMDPRAYLGAGRDAVRRTVIRKMKLFGSEGMI
ncbi:hypothetical protein A3B32_01885 [Candidatus Uhrbacteria bacterium RIFCSPLOWO2_01_FULL_53_9]|uniref:Fructose-1,6-bisphosphate aldolase, class II n=2 Tax=Candidatus Uhriibacteriota TaxID=1752732 RepID=A0A1F7UZY7_9BACT|nr:MAG: hypothetical protein A3B32_01885 [Candidatus Uhrbacteria bacterium RIFCSPLOWO2_01_FULL_53_9]OGL89263.1 MAG: hypothetical protein A3I45_04860 [Candidatus Uhrbacteria bacterium RIFCSPLOWO2_02_FULL_53_10]